MRSVFVWVRATPAKLRACLDELAHRQGTTEQWLYPDSIQSILYIQPTDELYDELEPETQAALDARFDGRRVSCLSIDVSGRCDGEREVREVVSALLRRFDGVAMDDWSEHLWTLEEIDSGKKWEDRRFFLGS